jgi:hypothetical protein
MLESGPARRLTWVKRPRGEREIPTDFELRSERRGDVLIVTFVGASNDANSQAMTRRYFELVLGAGCSKVLADLRALRGRLTGAGTFFLVRNLPVERVPTGIKTAIVEAPENRAYAAFLETTAANAGVYFRCFVDYGEALAWLDSPVPASRA